MGGGVRSRISYAQENHLFHLLCEEGLLYMCMADEVFGRRLPFAFLEDTAQRFTAMHGRSAAQVLPRVLLIKALLSSVISHTALSGLPRPHSLTSPWLIHSHRRCAARRAVRRLTATTRRGCSQALPYECQASFAPIMAQQMAFFSSDEGADVMHRVRGEILDVKRGMVRSSCHAGDPQRAG